MPVKVVLMYKFAGSGGRSPGGTEPLYYLGNVTDLSDPGFGQTVADLMNARTELMGDNVRAIGWRGSFPGVRRRSFRRVSGTLAGISINPGPIVSQGSADQANSALQVEVYSPKLQRGQHYMSGLPDAFITTAGAGGPDFGAQGLTGYSAKWEAWKALYTNTQWGFKALADLPNGQPYEITSWTQQPDTPFELIMGVASDQGIWGVNDVVHVRSVLMQNDREFAPNGRWKVRAVSTVGPEKLYVLRNSAAYDATRIEQPGTVESVGYEYVPFKLVQPVNQTGRRRGIGPVRPRGRSPGRQRRQAV